MNRFGEKAKSSYENHFLADERNKMRRYWIDTLLKLHSEQIPANGNTSGANIEEEDDDDIVEIVDTKTIVQPSLPLLDSVTKKQSNIVFKNIVLNQEFCNESIPRFVIDTLNKIFPRSLHIPDDVKKLVATFIKDAQNEVSTEQELKETFIRIMKSSRKKLKIKIDPKIRLLELMMQFRT